MSGDGDLGPLFSQRDREAAEEAREEALERVEAGAESKAPGWMDLALALLKRRAEHQRTLTSEDLWEELPQPPEPRAMGAVFRKAQVMGWIETTPQYVPGTRPTSHGRPVRVWRSRIYGGWRDR